MRAIYQRAGRQEGEGQEEEKVTTPVSRSHVLWPRTDQRVEHIRARIYKTRTSCGGERDPFLSLSLFLSLHPKRERTPEETTPRRFSYYFWESLGPIVLAIPRDSVPFFLPSWSEMDERRKTRKGESGRRRVRCNRDDSNEVRRDDASFLSSSIRETLLASSFFFFYFLFFLSFLFFIRQETSTQSEHRCRGGGGGRG